MPFVPPSGIREPSPRMALAPSRIDVTPRTGVLRHLCSRQSWSRSEPRTRGHKVWAMKSRLVARRNSSIEHRRTWVRSRNLHFLAEERQWLLKNSIGLRSTRSISPCSAPSRKAISRLRYLFRPRTASWSIRVSYCASGPSFSPSTEVSGALIVNAT